MLVFILVFFLFVCIFFQVLVFDFGSEVYSWSGRRASSDDRRAALRLARELWDEPYDYSDCDINPVAPVLHNTSMTGQSLGTSMTGQSPVTRKSLVNSMTIDWSVTMD